MAHSVDTRLTAPQSRLSSVRHRLGVGFLHGDTLVTRNRVQEGTVGIYDEYLNQSLSIQQLNALRWEQLARISTIRGRDVLVYAADFRKGAKAPVSIDYGDLLPFNDRLQNLTGVSIDLILETPGGSGEVAEDLVRLLRDRYPDYAVVVPGWAKSAGTIMAMAADEILMGPASALGPIDAQLQWQGKVFSADALLKGFDDIKAEVLATGVLNKAYIPMLQTLSPGELKEADNQLAFARELVTNWLAQFKFKNWTTHSTTGAPVTPEDRVNRANDIASDLCNHGKWFTHGKSLRISDLRALKLQITDYSETAELNDAILRYFTLLQMLFDSTTVYKLWEVPGSYIVRHTGAGAPAAPTVPAAPAGKSGELKLKCPKCANELAIQLDFEPDVPLEPGRVRYPVGDKLKCPSCDTEIDLIDARRQVELQAKRPLVISEEEAQQ